MSWTEPDRNNRSPWPGAYPRDWLPLSIAEDAPFGIALFDQTLHLSYANKVFSKLNGQSKDGHALKAEIFNALIKPLQESLRNGTVASNIEISTKADSGHAKHFLVTVFPVSAQPQLICSLFVDITDRIEAKVELEWNQKRLQNITDIIPMMVTYLDRDYRYRFNNKTYDEWFEIPHDSIRGMHASEVLGREGFAISKPWMDRALAGETVVWERSLQHPRKGLRQVQIYCAPDSDPSGYIHGLVAAIRDVTDERDLDSQLRKTIQVRDDFLSIAAHELRSPLTAVKLQNQMLLKMAQSPGGLNRISREQVLKSLEISSSQIQNLTRLTEEFLDVTYITEGQMSVHLARVDLVEVVTKVLDDYRPRLESEGIATSFVHQGPVVGNWDRFRIEQVFVNLLSNAMKYGEKSPIQIRVSRRDANAILEVQDNGIGIDPQDHQRIFERFTRAVEHKHIRGWGLGLYISRQIVLAHSGSISVNSRLGHGATFSVVLPLHSGPLHSEQDRNSGEQSSTERQSQSVS